MPKSRTRFKEAMDEGIERIVWLTQKNRSIIHDELGFALGRDGGGSISYFRYGDGNIPAKLEDIEKLAHAILARTDLGRDWLERFLESAGYPNLKWFCDQHFPPPLSIIPTMPPKSYRDLVGRNQVLNEILAALRDRNGARIITIDGMGGIGKTSLVQEAVQRVLANGLYDGVIWISVMRNHGIAETLFHYETLLNEIGAEMGDLEMQTLRLPEKENRIKQYLREQRIILVVDALEAAGQNQDEITRRLHPLLTISKALLTSRLRFQGDIHPIHLLGLSAEVAPTLIEQIAAEKKIESVRHAGENEMTSVFHSTGGSPLAMKLVVGQLEYLPIKVVLERLKSVVLAQSDRDDEYSRLYRYIFWPSWGILGETEKGLLVSLSHFAPGLGGTFSALQAINNYSENALGSYIHDLWKLSLVEIGESIGLRDKRYYLHTLTQNFVRQDVVGRQWPEQIKDSRK